MFYLKRMSRFWNTSVRFIPNNYNNIWNNSLLFHLFNVLCTYVFSLFKAAYYINIKCLNSYDIIFVYFYEALYYSLIILWMGNMWLSEMHIMRTEFITVKSKNSHGYKQMFCIISVMNSLCKLEILIKKSCHMKFKSYILLS